MLSTNPLLKFQLTANQLVQSHTPLKKIAHEYANKDVLVLGGRRDECRRVAESCVTKPVPTKPC